MKSHSLTINRTSLITFIIAITISASILCYFFYLQHYLTVAHFHDYKKYITVYVALHPIQSIIMYFFLYLFLVIGFLPAGALLNLVGGFLFDTPAALICANSAATLGACVNLMMVRYLLHTYLKNKYRNQLDAFMQAYHKNHIYYLLSVRFTSLFPFPLVNTLTGLTNVSLRTYFWTTCVGILPGQALFIVMGKQLGAIHHLSDIMTPQLFLSFLFFGLLLLLPTFYKGPDS